MGDQVVRVQEAHGRRRVEADLRCVLCCVACGLSRAGCLLHIPTVHAYVAIYYARSRGMPLPVCGASCSVSHANAVSSLTAHAARHVTRVRIGTNHLRSTRRCVPLWHVAPGTHYMRVAPLRTLRRRSRGACRRVASGCTFVSFASHSVARRLEPDRTAPPPRTRRGSSRAPTQTARARSAAGSGPT